MNDEPSLSPDGLELKQALIDALPQLGIRIRDHWTKEIDQVKCDKDVETLRDIWPIQVSLWTLITPEKHKDFRPKLASDQIMSRGDWEPVVDDGEFSEGFTYRRRKAVKSKPTQ